LTLEPGGYATTTDQYGNYFFSFLPPNTYTVSEVFQANWEQTCPPDPGTYTVILTQGQYIDGIIFGNRAVSQILDLSCSVGGGPARPGFQKIYGINFQNKGTVMADAVVILSLPSEVSYVASGPGGVYDSDNHVINWIVNGTMPGYTGWTWATVQIPPETPIGTVLTSNVTILPTEGDENPEDNTDAESQVVRGSYDPNEKLVSPEGVIQPTEMLTYQINFQNVGNDTAFNVTVRDTLDQNLDIATFISGASIHSYTYSITGREISWTFADINLPPRIIDETGSNGFIKFSAYPRAELPGGTAISNRGFVYFDFNPPLATNAVQNLIAGGGCSYQSGDANGNGIFNGIDISYMVNYLKGIGPVPPDSCNCLPHGMIYSAADANGNCVFNGLDVIYSVNYLKGIGPAPAACPDCPPARIAPPPRE
jgi:uncharacterized repeat protein (TIGR01451 family)